MYNALFFLTQGYLGHCLSQQCGLHFIGVERVSERIGTALKRDQALRKGKEERATMTKKLSTSPGTFSCVQMDVDSSLETEYTLQHILKNVVGEIPGFFLWPMQWVSVIGTDTGGMCLVGLHCCGDLATCLLSLYARCHTTFGLSCMILVPCCYHKLSLSKDGKWIPLSHSMKAIIHSANCFLNVCALRLAAQDSNQRFVVWEDTHATYLRTFMWQECFVCVSVCVLKVAGQEFHSAVSACNVSWHSGMCGSERCGEQSKQVFCLKQGSTKTFFLLSSHNSASRKCIVREEVCEECTSGQL